MSGGLRVSVRLDGESHQRLTQVARTHKKTVSALLKEGLISVIIQYESGNGHYKIEATRMKRVEAEFHEISQVCIEVGERLKRISQDLGLKSREPRRRLAHG